MEAFFSYSMMAICCVAVLGVLSSWYTERLVWRFVYDSYNKESPETVHKRTQEVSHLRPGEIVILYDGVDDDPPRPQQHYLVLGYKKYTRNTRFTLLGGVIGKHPCTVKRRASFLYNRYIRKFLPGDAGYQKQLSEMFLMTHK